MPAALTLALVQVPPACTLKTEPTGNWSFVARLLVCAVLPPGLLSVSVSASITVATRVATLLAALLSFVAPVVPVKVTAVVASSTPPWAPGAR